MKRYVLLLSIAIASGLLLTNVYTSMVDSSSWGSAIPQSILTAREYFKASNPGKFFRVFSPLNQLLGLAALIGYWRTSRRARFALAAAFLLYVLGDVLTFAYFYPRNEILFNAVPIATTEVLRKVWHEWDAMNWVRSLILLVGILFSFSGLNSIYQRVNAAR